MAGVRQNDGRSERWKRLAGFRLPEGAGPAEAREPLRKRRGKAGEEARGTAGFRK